MTGPACGAVAVEGDLADRFATLHAPPLTAASIQLVPHLDLDAGRLPLVWHDQVHGTAGAGQCQRLCTDGDRWVLEVDGVARLEVDGRSGRVRLASRPDVAAQLLAGVALPALAQRCGAELLHASVVARDGAAIAVTGPSGAGKSTLLRAAVDAGWEALCEDVAVLDPPPGQPRVWPGPPWVRLDRATELLPPWRELSAVTDKRAWDLRDRLAPVPRQLQRIVVLEPPGGGAVRWQTVRREQAVGLLVPQIAWFGAPGGRAGAAFRAAVRLARTCDIRRLRLPRCQCWAEDALDLVSAWS